MIFFVRWPKTCAVSCILWLTLSLRTSKRFSARGKPRLCQFLTKVITLASATCSRCVRPLHFSKEMLSNPACRIDQVSGTSPACVALQPEVSMSNHATRDKFSTRTLPRGLHAPLLLR
jgi:hypothetical protein